MAETEFISSFADVDTPAEAPAEGESELREEPETEAAEPESEPEAEEAEAEAGELPPAESEPEPEPEPEPEGKRTYKGKVDGQEMTFEKSDEEVVRALQKESASDRRFQEAAQAIKGMRQFADDLLDFETQTPSGRSKALDTIVQLVAKKSTGGDVPKAIQLVEEQLLGPYVQSRLEEEMLPDGERERKRAERERDEYRQRLEEERAARESGERSQRAQEMRQVVLQHWDRRLEAKGLSAKDDDVITAENLLAKTIDEGQSVTEEHLDRLLDGILELRKTQRTRALESMDPAELWEKHPELAEKILQAREKRTGSATTSPRTRPAVPTQDADATPPRRRSRAPKTPSYSDTYEDFFDKLG